MDQKKKNKPNWRLDHTGQLRIAFEKNRKKILATQTVCGKLVDFTKKTPASMSPTIDHIISISHGGRPSDINNLQLAHFVCNRMKSNMVIKRSFENAPKEKLISNRNLPQTVDGRAF